MNKTCAEARTYSSSLGEYMRHNPNQDLRVFIIPPAIAVSCAAEELEGSGVLVGVQNIHWEEQGAFTGEISAKMAKECGAGLVEIGHSERRHLFGESDEQVNWKTRAALKHGLIALICVGEPLQERTWGSEIEYVVHQVKAALYGVTASEMTRVWLAYEPVWAIGEGAVPAEPEYAQQMHSFIRRAVSDKYGASVGEGVPILYGGSVSKQNTFEYIVEKDIDGLFVGRAALEVSSFTDLIASAASSAAN